MLDGRQAVAADVDRFALPQYSDGHAGKMPLLHQGLDGSIDEIELRSGLGADLASEQHSGRHAKRLNFHDSCPLITNRQEDAEMRRHYAPLRRKQVSAPPGRATREGSRSLPHSQRWHSGRYSRPVRRG
jgi:hypothetical protein